jgi:hypothetical protein
MKIFALILFFSSICNANIEQKNWLDFSKAMRNQQEIDRREGISYIISGSLALVGGVVGDQLSKDASEAAAYTVFQTIGVASVGYGFYVWKIGENQRSVYETLNLSKLNFSEREEFIAAHNIYQKNFRKNDRFIRAITHGMIAGLNFYNGSKQKQDSLKNSFYFIGGVSLMACLSYSFEFE